jgi:hypothetical protein
LRAEFPTAIEEVFVSERDWILGHAGFVPVNGRAEAKAVGPAYNPFGISSAQVERWKAIERAAREYLAALDAFSADGSSRKIDTGLLHQCSKAKEAIRLALDAK